MLNQRVELTRDLTRFGVMRLLLGSPASRLTVTKPVRSIKPNTSLIQGRTLPSYTHMMRDKT
jgi:isopropylmalate/homocitrate/citramalate synthase